MARRKLNRSFVVRISRRVRYFYLRLILLPDTPHNVALGAALGIFVGLTPTVAVQMAIAVFLAWLLGGSKVAAAIGVWISNPLTIPPLYAAFYYLGKFLSPFMAHAQLPPDWGIQELLAVGGQAFLTAMIGGLVMGIVAAPLTYIFIFKNIGRLQAWERKKLREKFDISPPNTRRKRTDGR